MTANAAARLMAARYLVVGLGSMVQHIAQKVPWMSTLATGGSHEEKKSEK